MVRTEKHVFAPLDSLSLVLRVLVPSSFDLTCKADLGIITDFSQKVHNNPNLCGIFTSFFMTFLLFSPVILFDYIILIITPLDCRLKHGIAECVIACHFVLKSLFPLMFAFYSILLFSAPS